jgi:UDP-2,4-diacetamido-2,4,6-trideoxy-beta-L-altropyranose hydrolase
MASYKGNRASTVKISLRPANIDDRKIIWEWANDPLSRRASFSSERILWEQHIHWFELKLNDSNCMFLVVQIPVSILVGTVRFQIERDNAVISINIAPGHRGRGIGREAIRLSSMLLFQTTSTQTIHAIIKTENTRSIKAFEKAGYRNAGQVWVQQNPAYDYIMARGENGRT